MKFSSLQKILILFLGLWIILLVRPASGQTLTNLSMALAEANEAVAKTNWSKADQLFRQITSDYPTNTDGWLGLAESLYAQKRYQEALPNFQAVNFLKNGSGYMQARLGDCYFSLKKYKEAESCYRNALRDQPTEQTHFWLGMTLQQLQRLQNAAIEVRKASAATASADEWDYVGRIFYDSDLPEDALYCYQNEFDLNPSEPNIWKNLGSCQFLLGRYRVAAGSFRMWFSLNPTNYDAACSFESALQWAGELREARHLMKTLVNLSDNTPASNKKLGSNYLWLRMLPEAENSFRYTIALEPTNVEARLFLGDILYSERKYLSASQAYQEAGKLDSTNFQEHFSRGEALMFLGSYRDAAPEFETALKVDSKAPHSTLARSYLFLLIAPYFTTYPLHPMRFPSALSFLLIEYFLVLFVVIRASFQRTTADRPSWWLTLGWFLVFEESYFAWIFLVGFFVPTLAPENLVFGANFRYLALLIAAIFAFPHQSWGAAFQRLRSIPWALLARAAGILILIMLLNFLYARIFRVLFHFRLPEQLSAAFVRSFLEVSPLWAFVSVVILGPLCEEVLFRGLLFGLLEKRCGNWAILWTALAFAAVHRDLDHFIPVACIGAVLGWVRWKSRSVWVGAILHGSYNLVATLIIYNLWIRQ